MMNDNFLEVVMTRRSVRDFKKGVIPPEDIEKILRAGTMAPSPSNSQPWQFHIIRGSAKEKLIEVLANTSSIPAVWQQPVVKGIGTVPVVVAVENPVFTSKASTTTSQGTSACTSDRSKDITSLGSLLGTAACVENMLLTTHSLGYGSVWIGSPGVLEAAKQVIETSGQIVAVLPIGHPADDQKEYFNRSRKPVEEVARFYS
ncbi:MAG: nitroreductase family protein [Actinobacteria bacterium]|nr:nitroreductase family protein [Actinomycetota bacterium]